MILNLHSWLLVLLVIPIFQLCSWLQRLQWFFIYTVEYSNHLFTQLITSILCTVDHSDPLFVHLITTRLYLHSWLQRSFICTVDYNMPIFITRSFISWSQRSLFIRLVTASFYFYSWLQPSFFIPLFIRLVSHSLCTSPEDLIFRP